MSSSQSMAHDEAMHRQYDALKVQAVHAARRSRYERRSVMVTSDAPHLVFSPWDRNVRAPSRLSPVRYVTVTNGVH